MCEVVWVVFGCGVAVDQNGLRYAIPKQNPNKPPKAVQSRK